MPSALRLRLLGEFTLLVGNGGVLIVNTHRLQAFIAYLALHRDLPQPRQRLAFLFWPDSPEPQARSNLRNLIHQLRHALPQVDDLLCTTADNISWNPNLNFSLDVNEFENALGTGALEQAVELYHGDLLPDCYDDWAIAERERLQQRYIGALERLIQQTEDVQHCRVAIGYAHRLLAIDPLHEAIYRQLMRLCALSDDRVSVMRAYDRCAAALQRELDVEPSLETRRAYHHYLQMAASTRLQSESISTEFSPGENSSTTHADTVSTEDHHHNLPLALTRFVGRKQEKCVLERLITEHRLVTLTGTGGVGKTRLALETAQNLFDHFHDGIWLVEFAPLSDPVLIPQSVANVLGVRDDQGERIAQILIAYLRTRSLLLIFDNCEHLIAAVAPWVNTLLQACPNVHVLATSRETLSVEGEITLRVPPLTLPGSTWTDVQELMQYEAVRLFIDRAIAVRPEFLLTSANAPALAQVCARLDGIPLAIELAASRIKVMAVNQIAARLDDRFHLLNGGSRTGIPHQQTLRATIDWSYDLLSHAEQVLLNRLSVFAGGWSLEAVEFVCSDAGIGDSNAQRTNSGLLPKHEVLDILIHLVDKSLVMAEEAGSETRYRLLETIRQYAFEKLSGLDEAEQLRNRHLEYFLDLAQRMDSRMHSLDATIALEHLDRELDNLRAALDWSTAPATEPGDNISRVQTGLCLAGALRQFWFLQGYYREGKTRIESLLLRSEATPRNLPRLIGLITAASLCTDNQVKRIYREEAISLARELGEAGHPWLAEELGTLSTYIFEDDPARAEAMLAEAMTLARSISDVWRIAFLLTCKGRLAVKKREFAAARQTFEESIRLYLAIGDQRSVADTRQLAARVRYYEHDFTGAAQQFGEILNFFREMKSRPGISAVLGELACVERSLGHYEAAKKYCLEALDIRRESGMPDRIILSQLGLIALRLGDLEAAQANFAEHFAVAQTQHNQKYLGYAALDYGSLMAMEHKAQPAVTLLAFFMTFFGSGEYRDHYTPTDEMDCQHYLALARAELDDAAFQAAWEQGRSMTLGQVMDYLWDQQIISRGVIGRAGHSCMVDA